MKFAFIHAEKASFPVAALCRLLGVTRQGYYAYVSRPPSERLKRERALQQRVQQVHAESRGTYGSPRVLATLQQRGEPASKRRVERALRSLGLRGGQTHCILSSAMCWTGTSPRHVRTSAG